ncbi:MAG: Prenyltransferase and squalene oxidase repeat protein [Methanoregula sp. PtaU1.Bin006]|nr:MAG: Prenyltransferase and squalene oxidase repeat protein [Methanoregula sp. PtaB.Bin085]OPY32916.1 MAG: Prenyltransferase and squalene oxidase repeat protein [Methanoregula sp. PtaU1.Bin006]
MPMIPSRETTIRYILERRCESGGYCFYRLDEPNAGDTYYALAALAILDARPHEDEATRRYLHAFQRGDSSFPNVNVGHAVIRSLALLGERPAMDPRDWILSAMVPPGDTSRPVESSSLFEPLYHLTGLCRHLGIEVPPGKKDELLRAILRYRHPDGGFGEPFSTMIETAHALSVLQVLDPSSPQKESGTFLTQCEDPEYGFLSVPGARPAFLEHIHAGILACSLTGYPSPAFGRCREFIVKCIRENGGYCRSVFGGSATLENTWLAVTAMKMMDDLDRGVAVNLARKPAERCCD